MLNNSDKLIGEINGRDLAVSIVIGSIPSIGLFLLFILTIYNWALILTPLGLVFFTWSAYNQDGIRSRFSTALFWLSVEVFLAPVAMLMFLISGEGGGYDWAAAIADTIIFVVTWMLAWVVGIVLYLVSRRLEE